MEMTEEMKEAMATAAGAASAPTTYTVSGETYTVGQVLEASDMMTELISETHSVLKEETETMEYLYQRLLGIENDDTDGVVPEQDVYLYDVLPLRQRKAQLRADINQNLMRDFGGFLPVTTDLIAGKGVLTVRELAQGENLEFSYADVSNALNVTSVIRPTYDFLKGFSQQGDCTVSVDVQSLASINNVILSSVLDSLEDECSSPLDIVAYERLDDTVFKDFEKALAEHFREDNVQEAPFVMLATCGNRVAVVGVDQRQAMQINMNPIFDMLYANVLKDREEPENCVVNLFCGFVVQDSTPNEQGKPSYLVNISVNTGPAQRATGVNIKYIMHEGKLVMSKFMTPEQVYQEIEERNNAQAPNG